MIKIEAEDFIPDFYLLCSHGVDMWTFSYLLGRLGFPASVDPCSIKNGKFTNINFPEWQAKDVILRGATIDYYFLGSPLIYGDIKTIQIVRDPVDALTTYINWHIARGLYGKYINLPVFNDDTCLEFFINNFFMLVMYSSMWKCLGSNIKPHLIDMSDLLGCKCKSALGKAIKYLVGDGNLVNTIQDEIYEIPYNSLENRIWKYQRGKYFMGKNCKYIGGFVFYPSFLHEYYSYLEKKKIFDHFMHENKSYTISAPETICFTLSEINDLKSNSFTDNFKRALEIFLMHKKNADKLYKKYVFTPDKTISIFRSKPKTYTWIKKLLDFEMRIPIQEIPKKVENWKNYHKL